MAFSDWLQVALFILLLLAAVPILGEYMAQVYQGQKTFLSPVLGPLEMGVYAVAGVNPSDSGDWKKYTQGLLWFNALGFLFLLGLLLLQAFLPLNPQKLAPMELGVAVNTAMSFMTNTNWQAYSGESTLSYLSQMLGLGVQNFVSAATGMAVMVVLARGLAGKQIKTLGNFWVDLTRSVVYILLPLSLLLALALVSQGVVQSFSAYPSATTLEGAQQVVPLGPAASQIAIKQLGTNGGGFFGINSAHPFENPTPVSNFLQMLAILLIPAALTWTYGRLVGSLRQGIVLLAAMGVLAGSSLGLSLWAEFGSNPASGNLPFLEGKETRFGIVNSVIWSVSTTLASNGSVNAMHDSFSPLAGGLALFNMMLGEVVFGGVGAGLYGILMFVILTVFIAGLMVGRSPEYLGKKIEGAQIRMAALAVILPSAVVLLFTALAVLLPVGLKVLNNAGPHGLSEILYAFTSMANNNGSAFGGLTVNTPFYTWLGALAMLIGRFGVILPVMAIAGQMAQKQAVPASGGTFPTDGGLFVILLVSVILIIGGLTFFPVLALGPLVEHGLMLQGKVF
ncbi:MAG: potassium-transporting ATPase subunit KdpA [Candidatus Sericytochromatia bacterium]